MPRRFGRLADYQIFNPQSKPRMATAKTLPFNDEPPAAKSADEPRLIRPVKRLADEPVVATVNDIDIAFAELTWIAFKLDTTNKLLNTELDILRKKYQPHFQVDPKASAALGEPPPQTLSDRKAAIEAAVMAYAKDHKNELVTEKLKTKDFGVGTIAFKLNPESLMPFKPSAESEADIETDAPTEADPSDSELLDKALHALLDEYQLPQAIERALKKKAGETDRKLSDFLRCKWSWDASGIVKIFKDKLLGNDALEPLGIKVDRKEERIEIHLKP